MFLGGEATAVSTLNTSMTCQGISSLGTAVCGAASTIAGLYVASVNSDIQAGDYAAQRYTMDVQSQIAASDIDAREEALADVEAISLRRMEQREARIEAEGDAKVAAATVAEQKRTSEETAVDLRSLYFFGNPYA